MLCSVLVILVTILACLTQARPGLNSIHQSINLIGRKTTMNTSSISISTIRGGNQPSSETTSDKQQKEIVKPTRRNLKRNLLGIWGVAQVVSILANALKRLIPIAIEPFQQNNLLPFQWAILIAWTAYLTYAEGYKAFHLKFCPMVVQRSFDLIENPSLINYIFAGPYAMGLFNASKKRMIVGWILTAGVFSLAKLVKLLPYPYRAIIDAGVVGGLSFGTTSLIFLAIRAIFGGKVE